MVRLLLFTGSLALICPGSSKPDPVHMLHSDGAGGHGLYARGYVPAGLCIGTGIVALSLASSLNGYAYKEMACEQINMDSRMQDNQTQV